jgi:hypothetical protein
MKLYRNLKMTASNFFGKADLSITSAKIKEQAKKKINDLYPGATISFLRIEASK